MTLVAPAVDVRLRIPEITIREMVSQIVAGFNPLRIILFGSYAYGQPKPESDVDLLVVLDTQERVTGQALEIRQYIKPLFGVDILVITPEKLQQRLAWGDSFLKEIVNNGVVLYESPDR